MIFLSLSTPYNVWQVRQDEALLTRSVTGSVLYLILLAGLFLYERTRAAKS